eukprot:TRINITY_DN388_c16_g1_i1.p1 TRINITY_DN388_c16_g1~~TRINITY_DN388_c16_g1_i1.p1  ORF type:complete len:177 (+),score=17.80 TRINITY_DN388_c16_g1_i1:110-640(+)
MPYHEYQVIGRRKPTETDKNPKIFRMRIFATNEVVAKSRFWYFINKTQKIKKTAGEILSVNEIYDKKPQNIKNFGISLRYHSRSNQVNIYKEYRDLTRTGAVTKLLTDMGGRHRTTYRRMQIMEVKAVTPKETRRASTRQFHDSKIKFPLPHRVLRAPRKRYDSLFQAKRPITHFR